MAINKSSGLLKWIVLGLAAVAVLIVVKVVDGGKKPSAKKEVVEVPVLSAEELEYLGSQGDTPSDTVATLVAQVKAMRTEMRTAQESNEKLVKENQRLRAREQEIDRRIEIGLQEERRKLNQSQRELDQQNDKAKTLWTKFQQQLDERVGSKAKQDELPVGFGLEGSDGSQFKGSDGLVWIEPSGSSGAGTKPTDGQGSRQEKGYSFSSGFTDVVDSSQAKLNTGVARTAGGAPKKEVRPVYTVPQNSTLMGSTSMTALVGRVPIDGTVNDPYPFKVLIGADNLTANGIDLPEVTGAVVSGTATGDWTLSCVRGQIRSITFVFNDGTVRTLPSPIDAAEGGNNASRKNSDAGQIQGGLGWISDPYGIPCIAGERKSNAKQYIGSQTLVTAAGAGVATLLGNEDESSSGSSFFGSSGGSSFGGSTTSGNQAMQQILNRGVSDISDWVNKLYGEAFAAIYVQPGAQVAIHIDQELQIDYEVQGRKVRYGMGVSHASTLD